jgi:hypothetical protein
LEEGEIENGLAEEGEKRECVGRGGGRKEGNGGQRRKGKKILAVKVEIEAH